MNSNSEPKMDITFIAMHSLNEDATLLYASHSITDVLGYDPQEVIGQSCFTFFDPDDASIARRRHGRGVQLDKAAVLAYCKLKTKYGEYRVCECVFTVVYTVVVSAISIRRCTSGDDERRNNARNIRHHFEEPRYLMIRHLSPKFISPASGQHEVRAALILNRFTRHLDIMYAQNSVEELFGLHPDDMKHRSFFECIQEPFLQSAVNALDRAKENNSIAYLAFTWRDPRPFCGRRVGRRQRQSLDLDDSDEEMHCSSGDDYEDDLDQPVIYVEAVVSCTSDGLVVVLRRSRFPVHQATFAQHSPITNDFCASPWAEHPLTPRPETNVDYMETIRQVAVFAWCVQTLNNTIAQYAKDGEYTHTQVLPLQQSSQPPGYHDLEDCQSGPPYDVGRNGHQENYNYHQAPHRPGMENGSHYRTG